MPRKSKSFQFYLRPLAIEGTGDLNWWANSQFSIESLACLLNCFAHGTHVEFKSEREGWARTAPAEIEAVKNKASSFRSTRTLVSCEKLDKKFSRGHGKLFYGRSVDRFTLFFVPTLGKIGPPDFNEYGDWFLKNRAGYLSIFFWKDHSPPLLGAYTAFFCIRTLIRKIYQRKKRSLPGLCKREGCLLYGSHARFVTILDSFYNYRDLCPACQRNIDQLPSKERDAVGDILEAFKTWLTKEMKSEDNQDLLHSYGTGLRDSIARTLMESWWDKNERDFSLLLATQQSFSDYPEWVSWHTIEPDEALLIEKAGHMEDVHLLFVPDPWFLTERRLLRFCEKFKGAKKVALYPDRPTDHLPWQLTAHFQTVKAERPEVIFLPVRGGNDFEKIGSLCMPVTAPGKKRSILAQCDEPKIGRSMALGRATVPPSLGSLGLYTSKTRSRRDLTDQAYVISPGLLHKVRLISSLKSSGILADFADDYEAATQLPHDLVMATTKEIFFKVLRFHSDGLAAMLKALDDLMRATHYYRDHFVHQFQVFLMGAVLMDRLKRALGLDPKEFETLEKQWVGASLLHDIGCGLERMPEWLLRVLQPFGEPLASVRRTVKTVGQMGAAAPSATAGLASFLVNTQMSHAGGPTNLTAARARGLIKAYANERRHSHCLISSLLAIEFYREGADEKNLEKLRNEYGLDQICQAIFFHHAYERLKDKWFDLTVNPLIFLLILCDAVQECGRPSGHNDERARFLWPYEPDLQIRYLGEKEVQIVMKYFMKDDEGQASWKKRIDAKNRELRAVVGSLASKTRFTIVLRGVCEAETKDVKHEIGER